MKNGGGAIIGSLIMVGIAVAVGAFNGFAVSSLGMIPFIVTFAIMVVGHGAAVWLTNAESVSGLPDVFVNSLTGRIGLVHIPIIVLIICGMIAHYILKTTIYGRKVYAVGINIKTAQVSG